MRAYAVVNPEGRVIGVLPRPQALFRVRFLISMVRPGYRMAEVTVRRPKPAPQRRWPMVAPGGGRDD